MSGIVNTGTRLPLVGSNVPLTGSSVPADQTVTQGQQTSIHVERSTLLDDLIKSQMSEISTLRDLLVDSSAAFSALRAARPKAENGAVDSSTVNFTDHTGQTQSVASWAAANGITTTLGATTAQTDALFDAKAAQAALQAAASANYASKVPTFVNAQGQTVSCFYWAEANGISTVPVAPGKAGATYMVTRASLQATAAAATAVIAKNQATVDAANHLNARQIDGAMRLVKATIDTTNAQLQLDMVRLQGLMDKRDQESATLTDTLPKTGGSIADTAGNRS